MGVLHVGLVRQYMAAANMSTAIMAAHIQGMYVEDLEDILAGRVDATAEDIAAIADALGLQAFTITEDAEDLG